MKFLSSAGLKETSIDINFESKSPGFKIDIDKMLSKMTINGASDLHIKVPFGPIYRIDGDLNKDDCFEITPRDVERQHRRGQHQLAGQVQGIEDQQHRVRLGRAHHLAAQYVDGDAGILAVGVERIDAGQVDECQIGAAHAGHQAHALLDGDAGKVGHLLAQAGQPIEKSGLAGVWRADQHHGLELPGARRGFRWNEGWGLAAGAHRAASSRSVALLAATFGNSTGWASAVAGRIRMAAAVSRRRAISMPSTL